MDKLHAKSVEKPSAKPYAKPAATPYATPHAKPTTKPTAKLITKSNEITKPLETFMATIGIHEPVEIYMYVDRAYVNINRILIALSVDAKDFKKRAEVTIDYITINNTMYVNKYGLIKILANSREAIAYMFIDYIFEVIYKLEHNGSVNISDVSSREELVKVLGELNLYKSTEELNISRVEYVERELQQYKADLEIVECENNQLANDKNIIEEQLVDLQEKYNIVQDAAKKLAIYVKLTGNLTAKKQASLDALDIDDEISSDIANADISDEDHEDIKSLALDAKKQLASKLMAKPSKQVKEISEKSKYYVLQSTTKYYTDDQPAYNWVITPTLPTFPWLHTDFKAYSSDYRLGGIETSVSHIWFADTILTNSSFKLINIVFNNIHCIDTETVCKLVHSYDK